MNWKAGDWVVFDLQIGQIKDLRDSGGATFSDGICETSGHLADRFRPLTLRNKVITETFDFYYGKLRELNGEAGFNYPDISSYFAELSRIAIDADQEGERAAYEKAQQFVCAARDYTPVIDGIGLFRRNLSRRG